MSRPDDVSALVLRIPTAEDAVRSWRLKYDTVIFNVPAHVTVVFPWLPPSDQPLDELAALAELAATTPPMTLTFAAFGEFTDVLYLEPQPTEPIQALMQSVVQRWPSHPPYGGRHGLDVVPHLTVATTASTDEWQAIRGDVTPQLPITCAVDSLTLLSVRDGRCSMTANFPLAGR